METKLSHAGEEKGRHDEAMHIKSVTHAADTRVIIYRLLHILRVKFVRREIWSWYVSRSLSVQCLEHFSICLVNRVVHSQSPSRDTTNSCSGHIRELRLRLRSGALTYHVVVLL